MSCSGSGVARLEAAAAKLLEDEEEDRVDRAVASGARGTRRAEGTGGA